MSIPPHLRANITRNNKIVTATPIILSSTVLHAVVNDCRAQDKMSDADEQELKELLRNKGGLESVANTV